MRGRLKTTNPFTEVWTEKVMVGGEEVPKMAIQIMDDDGKPQLVEIHSPDYRLVKNSVVRDVMDDIKSRSDYNWKPFKTHWDGKRFIEYSVTEERITSITEGEQGNHLFLGMMARNSYDGSGVFELGFFALNILCTNQYHSRNILGNYTMRHSENMENWDMTDALQNIGRAASSLVEMAPRIGALRSRPLTTQFLLDSKRNTRVCDSKWGKILDNLATEDHTQFGLFQAMTNVVSHELGNMQSIEVGNSVTDFFLEGRAA